MQMHAHLGIFIYLNLQLDDNMVKAKRLLETQKITTKMTFSAARIRYTYTIFCSNFFVTFAFRKNFHNKNLEPICSAIKLSLFICVHVPIARSHDKLLYRAAW